MSNVVSMRTRQPVIVPLTNGQTAMNPSTLLRLADAFPAGRRSRSVHVLRVGAEAGTWPTTIYKAMLLGYLERTSPAWFRPTELFWVEVYRARRARAATG